MLKNTQNVRYRTHQERLPASYNLTTSSANRCTRTRLSINQHATTMLAPRIGVPWKRKRVIQAVSAMPATPNGSSNDEARILEPSASIATAEPGKTTIGFVGMGILGVPMALNLIKAGYKVVVYNRSPDKCKPVVAAGAVAVSSAQEVAARSDLIFATLADPPAALEVAKGPKGVVAGLGPGKGYVDVSTVDAATSRAIAAAVHGAGAKFLEAPVSGSKGPAEQGKLIFLTAGDRELYEAAAAPLDAMGKAKFFLGDVGRGADMKLVVNMIMGTMMASYAEGLALAEQRGLEHEDVVNIVGLGAIAAPMFALKGPLMAKGSYEPAFPLKHQQKDLRLALSLGDALAQPCPIASAANESYIAARARGLGDQDFSAVFEVFLQSSVTSS